MPAQASLDAGCLPLGLAHQVRLKRDVADGAVLRWSDVETDAADLSVRVRREMESAFGPRQAAADAGWCGPPPAHSAERSAA
jgi:predicted homoserine dehydrogenase-like protein